ncbi:unnamed protein product [Cochlearia groenlandica]
MKEVTEGVQREDENPFSLKFVKNKAEKGTKQSRNYSILIIRGGGGKKVLNHISSFMIKMENHSKRLKHLHQKSKATSISKEAKVSSPKVQSLIYPFHHHSRPIFTKEKGRSIESPKKNLLKKEIHQTGESFYKEQ